MRRKKLLFVLSLLALLVTSCSEEIIVSATQAQTAAFAPVGEDVPVTLALSLANVFESVDSTGTRATEEYTAEENYITDAWVFEYDAATEELICEPQYFRGEEDIWGDIGYEVTLKDNRGAPVIIYAVANVGNAYTDEGRALARNWVTYNSSTKAYDGFMTIAELSSQTLPDAHAWTMAYDGSKYVLTDEEKAAYNLLCIPKMGNVNMKKLADGDVVLLTVYNMFAKVRVNITKDYWDFMTGTVGDPIYVIAENVPYYCTVGSLGGSTATDAADYSACELWQNITNEGATCSGSGTYYTPYIFYLPENIQGSHGVKSSFGGSIGGENNAFLQEPSNDDLCIYFDLGGGHRRDITPTIASTRLGGYPYFNVARNCVYDVTMNAEELPSYVLEVNLFAYYGQYTNRVTAAGTSNHTPGLVTVLYTYQEGINTYGQQVTPETTTYEILSGGDFATVDSSTGALTIEENKTVAAREVVVQVTAEYTPSSSTTLAASATCTVTQDAGTTTYNAPVVTLSYDKMPAAGGKISPKLTYSQSYTINGTSYTLTNESSQEDLAAAGLKIEYTFTSNTTGTASATVSMIDPTLKDDNGTIEVDESNANPAQIEIWLGTVDVAVTLNGLTGYASAEVYIEANTGSNSYTYTIYNDTDYTIYNFAIYNSNGEFVGGDAQLDPNDTFHFVTSTLQKIGYGYGSINGVGYMLDLEDWSSNGTHEWHIVGVLGTLGTIN